MKKNRILIIGANWEQVPLIKAAKNIGCEVIATSPSNDAEGFIYSDHFEIVDPRDLKAIINIYCTHYFEAKLSSIIVA